MKYARKTRRARRAGLVVATLATLLIVLCATVFVVPDDSLEDVSRGFRDAFEDALELITDNIEGVFDTAGEIREDLQEAAEKDE